MIGGYFLGSAERRRPFLKAVILFPTLGNDGLEVELLLDTGADRTILAPADALRLATEFGLDLANLPKGLPSTGVGGRAETRTIEAVVTLDTFSTGAFRLTILAPTSGPIPSIPSLLGRDILSHFALFLEERTNRVLLLEPSEADALVPSIVS